LDLPGTYSLTPRTPDEAVTHDVLLGKFPGEEAPLAIIAVADATNLERSLGFVLELTQLKKPLILALNMMDLAEKRGLKLDLAVLERELGIPVIPTVAVDGQGKDELLARAYQALDQVQKKTTLPHSFAESAHEVHQRFSRVDAILKLSVQREVERAVTSEKIDRILLNPFWGSLVLVIVLMLVFQAVFSWSELPTSWIEAGVAGLGHLVSGFMSDGALKSLIVDGIIAGVGGVVVFLPQIILLFLFILLLEDSGYMARAAFLMDRVMGSVGLHGRAFIPLLSSFACAIPGVMATRTIENRRDRLTTILVAPLMTCSARLPVYSLLIAAFIPNTAVFLGLKLQGLVLLALYVFAVVVALAVAFVFKRTMFKGEKPILLLELPTYKVPSMRGVLMGLKERAMLFIKRAGTVILSITVILWFLSSYPKAPDSATEPAIDYSYAGRIGHAIEPLIKPIGFDWRVGIAFVPGFAAREVMVSALATVYSIEGKDEEATAGTLGETLAKSWSLATGLSLLAWYVLAPQCLSTLAVVRRETNSWKWAIFMLTYMTALAYLFSFIVYRVTVSMGGG
ncbi:MAG: ferrous iron transport protein B, partial [Proteobacteria bacterium]